MRTLYFDIDGTVLLDGTVVLGDAEAVKRELGAGKFERALRSAGFERLVCVGNFALIPGVVRQLEPDYDGAGVLFALCRGAFQDEMWLRPRLVFVEDARNRARYIDLSGDWWYVDDLAEHYMAIAGLEHVFKANRGGRICTPDPLADGNDVIEWLHRAAL